MSDAAQSVASDPGARLSCGEAPATRKAFLVGLLSRAFVEPMVPVTGRDQHRRARLLAIFTLTSAALGAAGAAQSWLYASPQVARVVLPILLLTAVAQAVAHALSRVARTRAAAYVIVGTQLLVPLAVGLNLPRSEFNAHSIAAWLSLGVLTAGATLGSWEALAVGGAAVLAMVSLMQALGGRASETGDAGFFLVVMTILLLVYLEHRDGLERDRQALLRARNAELEELKSTLEQRVTERTEELGRRTADLSLANQTLGASQAMLIQTEKLAAVGRLTAGIAHELASPLSAALAALQDIVTLGEEYARSVGDPSVTPEDHRAIARELAAAAALGRSANERAVKFVRGIRAHTRDPGPQATERFDLARVVREAADLLAHEARATSVRVVLEAPAAPVTIFGVPSRMNQVVTNLLKNAIDAIASHATEGLVTIRVRREGAQAIVEVHDDGPGVAPEVLPRIFEPMFTTKAYGQGTGLGLAIVRDIVEGELHGRVSLRGGPGATFVVELPAHGG